jgi:hypothetical protein
VIANQLWSTEEVAQGLHERGYGDWLPRAVSIGGGIAVRARLRAGERELRGDRSPVREVCLEDLHLVGDARQAAAVAAGPDEGGDFDIRCK